jgi:1-deoxy-D-xylulose-5-phosphate reductoisomerase
LRLAFDALRAGGNAAAIVNAANEVAVEAFIKEQIGFTDIPALIESVLENSKIMPVTDLEMLISSDLEARNSASEWIAKSI